MGRKIDDGNPIDPSRYLKKSFREDGIRIKATDLSRPEQKALVLELFYANNCDREFIVKRFLARIVVERQKRAGMVVDPHIAAIASLETPKHPSEL